MIVRILAAALFCATATGCAARAGKGNEVSAVSSSARVSEPISLATPSGEIFGTLELPAAGRRVPVVLIIAGSGPTDRNGNTRGLAGSGNSLKMLADGLAARGVASVRYDKRGIAASRAAGMKEEDVRFTHFIDDAAAWIRKLDADPRFSTVTVVGHSEGSLIGMVAAREGGADAFVSLEGAGRRAAELIEAQLSAQLPPAIVAQAVETMKQLEAGQPPDTFPPMLGALFRRSVQPYLISWFAVSPAVEIAKLRMPVLIIQGTTDLQVTAEDAQNLAAASPKAKLVTIEGMNHVLKPASGTVVEQMRSYTDSTIAIVPQVVDEIVRFVAASSRPRDTALGPDKLQHFLVTGYVLSVGFAGMRAAGSGRDAALAVAVGGAVAASLGKELFDRRSYGLFSIADLVWDALGAGAAYLVLARTR